ncbi:MAG: YcaO-like family protein [Acidimicrobiia bacterium]
MCRVRLYRRLGTTYDTVVRTIASLRGEQFPFLATGASTNLDAELALSKALDEATFVLFSWCTNATAMLHKCEDRDSDEVRQINDHGTYYAADRKYLGRLESFFSGPIGDLPESVDSQAFAALVDAYDLLVVALGDPTTRGAWVVRAIVPELVPISFERLGVRDTHRSIAQLAGHPVGAPSLPPLFE